MENARIWKRACALWMKRFTQTSVATMAICAASASSAREPLEPPSIDEFTQIRVAWSKEPYVQPYWELANGRNLIFEAHRDKDYATVKEKSGVWLHRFPIDSPVHWMRAKALQATGDYAGYIRHLLWYRGLIASIMAGRDGRTPQTAFRVVALREEHFLVRDMGARIDTQDVIEVDGVPLHKVRTVNGDQVQTLYFDISVPLGQLERNTFPAPGKESRPGSTPAQILPPK